MSKPVRSLNHPTVRRILRQFAHAEAENCADTRLNRLFDDLSVEGWSNERIRAVVACIAMNASDDDMPLIEQWADDTWAAAEGLRTDRVRIAQLSKVLDCTEELAERLWELHRRGALGTTVRGTTTETVQ